MKTILTGLFALAIGFVFGQSELAEAEYYIDHDPGYGNGTSISISGFEATPNETIVNDMELGQHTFYLRALDENGNWGMDEAVHFIIFTPNDPIEFSPVSEVEYFFNQDPGYGDATPLTITTGFEVTIAELITNDVPLGFNSFTLRGKTEAGDWGMDQTVFFINQGVIENNPSDPALIVGYEYYLGDDPGIGDGLFVSVEENSEAIIQEWLSSEDMSNGIYQLSMRPKNDHGIWGLADWIEFEFLECESTPVSLEGPSEFCQGTGIILDAPEGYDSWYWNTHDLTESLLLYEGGTFAVSVYDQENHQCFHSNELEIEMISTLDPTFELTHSFTTVTLTATVPGQELTWEIDGEEVGSEDSFDFTFDTDGEHTVCLQVSNLCGTFETCETILVCSDIEIPPFFYLDQDEDGFGTPEDSLQACEAPIGYVANSSDCDDTDPEINPDAIEIENDGIDQNCDGEDFITGLIELTASDFNVYPNPTRGVLNVEFTERFSGDAHIYDMRGSLVHQSKINEATEIQFDTESFGSGFYILRLFNDKQQALSRISIL